MLCNGNITYLRGTWKLRNFLSSWDSVELLSTAVLKAVSLFLLVQLFLQPLQSWPQYLTAPVVTLVPDRPSHYHSNFPPQLWPQYLIAPVMTPVPDRPSYDPSTWLISSRFCTFTNYSERNTVILLVSWRLANSPFFLIFPFVTFLMLFIFLYALYALSVPSSKCVYSNNPAEKNNLRNAALSFLQFITFPLWGPNSTPSQCDIVPFNKEQYSLVRSRLIDIWIQGMTASKRNSSNRNEARNSKLYSFFI
jgi:hypothetical protein